MKNQKIEKTRAEWKAFIRKEKPNLKKIGLFSAIAAALLNGCSVGQIRYQGGYLQEPPRNLFKILYYGVFFEGSFVNFVIMSVIIFGIVFYIKSILHKKDANLDSRDFEYSKSGVYGTSKEMDEEEKEEFLHRDPDPANMTNSILGRDLDTNDCIEVRPDLPPEDKIGPHKLIMGSTGKRKTRSQTIPEIFQQISRGESFINIDPKGEVYEKTSMIAREDGYIVKIFNLVNPYCSDAIAFMKLVGRDSLMAQTIAEVLVANANDGGASKEAIWQKGERALIAFGILMMAMDDAIPDEEKTLGSVYNFLVNKEIEEIEDKANSLPYTNPAKRQWNIFQKAPEKVRDGIFTNLATDLQLLNEPAIQAITAYDEIDLTLPAKQKCAYYIIVSDQDDTMNYFATLMISFCFIKQVRYADMRPDSKTKIPVNYVIEELPNIGNIPGLTRKMNTIRSRDMRVTLTAQDIGQMMDRFPGHEWESLTGACATQIQLGLNDTGTNAEWWSKKTGTATVSVDSTRRQKNIFTPFTLNAYEQESEGQGKRLNYMSDELFRMPNDQALVFISGHNYLRVKKFDYTEHPYAKRIVPLKPFDHEPEWWSKTKDEMWFQEMLVERENTKNMIAQEAKEYEEEQRRKKIEAKGDKIESIDLTQEIKELTKRIVSNHADPVMDHVQEYDAKAKHYWKVLQERKNLFVEQIQTRILTFLKGKFELQDVSESVNEDAPKPPKDVEKTSAPAKKRQQETKDEKMESEEKNKTSEESIRSSDVSKKATEAVEEQAKPEHEETPKPKPEEPKEQKLSKEDEKDEFEEYGEDEEPTYYDSPEDFWGTYDEDFSDEDDYEKDSDPFADDDVFDDDFFTSDDEKDKYRPAKKRSDKFGEVKL